jgi:gamma-glutamyl:cysteine ligase YbdK (ATP-grasp superfamily)
MWRAIRYGLSGGLFDLGTLEVRPARAELERLAEWIVPVADELGIGLSIPGANAAERQIARVEEGWSLEEVYAEQVRPGLGGASGLRPDALAGNSGEVVRG